MINSLEDLDLSQRYSYADYLTWQFSERIELFKGYIRQMAAPTPKHQRVSREFTKHFLNFFDKNTCDVFYAPLDVRLYNRKKSLLADKDVYTVVQPDISIICDSTKIDDKGCNGAPDLIIEILSPSNPNTDIKDKYQLYQENGVIEYWIVYPNDAVIHQYVLKEEKYYSHGIFTRQDVIVPFLFPELTIDLVDVFA
ncbi:MAG: Uma2 family endonuclease [Cytophagales bacterium]|nr:MAG: Uma2 family endonuclease [Cytophagales bacterium]